MDRIPSQAACARELEALLQPYDEDGLLPAPEVLKRMDDLSAHLPLVRSFDLGPDYPALVQRVARFNELVRARLLSVGSLAHADSQSGERAQAGEAADFGQLGHLQKGVGGQDDIGQRAVAG
jgi:hypothetical protein